MAMKKVSAFGSAAMSKTASAMKTAGSAVKSATNQATSTIAQKINNKSERKEDGEQLVSNDAPPINNGNQQTTSEPLVSSSGTPPTEIVTEDNSVSSSETSSSANPSTPMTKSGKASFSFPTEKLQRATKSVVETTKTVGGSIKKNVVEGGKAIADVSKQVGHSIGDKVSQLRSKDSEESHEEDKQHHTENMEFTNADLTGNSPLVGSNSSGPSGAAFGIPVNETVLSNDGEVTASTLPVVVRETILCILNKKWFMEEGIFRLSAGHGALSDLKNKYNIRAAVSYDEVFDPHLPACLLKQFLRDLPEPLFTFQQLPHFNQLSFSGLTDKAIKVSQIQKLYSEIPQLNRNILRELFSLLKVVAGNADTNKMGIDNLAIIFIPTLKIDSKHLFTDLFQLHDLIFAGQPSLSSEHPNSLHIFQANMAPQFSPPPPTFAPPPPSSAPPPPSSAPPPPYNSPPPFSSPPPSFPPPSSPPPSSPPHAFSPPPPSSLPQLNYNQAQSPPPRSSSLRSPPASPPPGL